MLPIVPLAEFGRRFFVLLSLVSVVLIGLATLDRELDVTYWHFVSAACLIAYIILLPRQQGIDSRRSDGESGPGVTAAGRVAVLCLVGGIICGGTGVVVDALALSGSPPPAGHERVAVASGPLFVAGSVSSGLLLGAALVAMVLGHWYLVSRDLSFTALRRLTLALAVALGVRAIVGLIGLLSQLDFWNEQIGRLGTTHFLLSDGVFLLSRVLFGVVAPAVLVPLAWRCVRIESNQSATGILYVVLAFVVFGEILAKHFLVNLRVVI